MKDIAIILWSPAISGGTNVIFEHALAMLRHGYNVNIIMEEPLKEEEIAWFPRASEFSWQTFDSVADRQFDLAIATWWRTAFSLSKVNAKKHVFFVQSIESYFYPTEEVPLRALVDMTYLMPVNYVTEATWIKNHLNDHFGHTPELVLNGINKSFFTNKGKTINKPKANKLRVLVEGPLGVDFKNVERTIELCRESDCDEIWLLTLSDVKEYEGVDKVFSQIPIDKVGEVYRSCDVIVKLSKVEGMFGPPLEMYHCGGTSISYDVTGHDEYIRTGENGLVLSMDDEKGVVEAINQLKASPKTLKSLKAEALKTANDWPNWSQSGDEFVAAMENIFETGISTPAGQLQGVTDMAWKMYDYSEKLRLGTKPVTGPNPLQEVVDSQANLIDERDKYIKELEGKFDEFTDAIRSQDKLINDRDIYIKELEKRLTH